ncbi:DNA polymerase alpha, subunit B [Hypoxylon rubiginosum]|uniref:DNA polymerase alpha, subunit B n=1 Tax=Hypoxylon rubiginosum TaxID=110542 RepID=A0ACB9ZBW5_9PEZI|nr:DNA polymerase alpha, subunit B [Hypoxylon rubiginosum]
MAEADLHELNELFGMPNKELEPDVVSELQSIMRIHSLSAQDLYFKWESYSIKMDMDGNSLSLETLRALKQDIQDALERSNRTHHAHIKTEKRSAGTPRTAIKNGGDVYGMLEGMVPNTPATGKLSKSASKRRHQLETPSMTRVKGNIPSSSPDYKSPMRLENQLDSMNAIPTASFNDRTRPGEVIEVLNDHLKPPEPVPYAEPRIKLTATSDQKKLGYKTLAMKTSEASEILDDRIDEFVGYLRDYQNIDENEFGSAASQSTTEIVAVGRIASDSSEGRLNEASLILETSRRTGGGKKIHLNLQQAGSRYHFFPGQIVAFRGINSSGNEFTVKEVLEMPLLPSAASTPETLETHLERLRGGPDAMDSDDEPAPLNVIFGSGPYTADDNLDFEPLHALCSQAADTHADALILTGPFIDVDHPLIATGDFDLPEEASVDPDTATMSTVFKYMISPALNRLVALNSSITILLIPSVRDVIAKHVSWPQDLLPRKDLGLHKNARIIGNPMTLAMNEMVLGISSQDILWDLNHEELVGGRPTDPNIASRTSKYVIEQRHYFPIFPPVDRQKLLKVGTTDGLPTGAMLDTSYLKLGEMVNVRPDVMIMPSALPPFARVVESVLVINPGYLSKRRGAGTYARMTLFPLKLEDEEVGSEGRIGHQVFKRARVEITRI